nr:hypothetical protein [Micromonospora sp. DSM 115978]
MARQRVLLIRPWDAARGGAGCCAGATDLCVEDGHEDPALARQRTGERPLGDLYLAVRAGLPPEVEVEIVDPQNTLFLLPAVLRDGRRNRRPWWGLLRDLTRASGYSAIIVNGRVVSDADPPDPAGALRLIRRALAADG